MVGALYHLSLGLKLMSVLYSDLLLFFQQFLRHPKELSSVIPSSKSLGDMAISAAQLDQARVIVELGAGLGGITEQILKVKPRDTRFLAIEINEDLIKVARKRCPETDLILGNALHLDTYLSERGEESCDAIISAIPWAVMDSEKQSKLLATIYDNLKPGGRFVTLAFLVGLPCPASRRFREAMSSRFGKTGMTPIVWRNLPPAVILWGEKE